METNENTQTAVPIVDEPLQLKKPKGLPMYLKVTSTKQGWLVNLVNTKTINVGDKFLIWDSEFEINEIREHRIAKGDYSWHDGSVYFQSVLCKGIRIYRNDF